MPNQTHTALPHLPKGMSLPHVQVNEQPLMPGVKSLPAVEWKDDNNAQVVPQADPGSQKVVQRRTSLKQGIPLTERKTTLQSDVEPPPMFSAQPNRMSSVRITREPKVQKQVYRMDSGIDPVTLLSGRLECWKTAIKNLVGVFKKIVEAEENASKSWIGAGKTINVPFKDAHGQFLQSGGIQDVWSAIRDYSNEHGILHHNFANYVRDALIPALRGVKEDIKKMVASIQGDKQLKSTEIFNCRLKVDRNIARLDKAIQAVERAPHVAHQTIDPFIANLCVIHSIRELCDHENILHDHALQLQQETGIFELKIVESLRFIMKNLQDFRLQNKMEYIDTIGMIQATFDNIQPTTEWNDFVQRHQNSLVMENSAYKTESSVEYPNQNHRLVRASKIGQLYTKKGVTRNMNEGVFILTPTGYLHGYKTPQYFQSNPLEPTFSIFMPNNTVTMDESDPTSIVIRGNKSGKMAAAVKMMDKSYQLYTRSPEEAKDWFGALNASSTQYQVTHLIDTSRPSFSAVQQHRNLPPLPASTLPLLENEKTTDPEEGPSNSQNSNNTNFNNDNDVPTTSTVRQIEGPLTTSDANSPNQDSYQSTSYGNINESSSNPIQSNVSSSYPDGNVSSSYPDGNVHSSYPDGNVDLYSAPEEMNKEERAMAAVVAPPIPPMKDSHIQQDRQSSTYAIQNPIIMGHNAEMIGSTNQNASALQNATNVSNTTNLQSDPVNNTSHLQGTTTTTTTSGGLNSVVNDTQNGTPAVQNIPNNIQNKSEMVSDEYADPTLSSTGFANPQSAITTTDNVPSSSSYESRDIQQQQQQISKELPSKQTYEANLNPSIQPYSNNKEEDVQFRDPPIHINQNST